MPIVNRRSSIAHTRYAIDLLRGEGVPIRSRPGGIAFACLVVVVPFLAASGTLSFYLDCQVVIAIQRQQISKLAAAIDALSGAVQKKESMETEKDEANRVLSDVKTALAGRTQWSPILASLVDNLSDTLVLTKVEARQSTTRRQVPAKDDPTRTIDASVPVRELKICVCGQDKQRASEAVRMFQESLRSSPALGPLLDTITVSRDVTTLESREAVLYELSCVFKPTGVCDM
ncbi:MAG: hypothetical protein MUC88_03290 [Planctomycetes bacterium]|jgi:Tfp pilus assembly protein PilN|nr:hypothetical protein [Planctomycetota bacterium]